MKRGTTSIEREISIKLARWKFSKIVVENNNTPFKFKSWIMVLVLSIFTLRANTKVMIDPIFVGLTYPISYLSSYGLKYWYVQIPSPGQPQNPFRLPSSAARWTTVGISLASSARWASQDSSPILWLAIVSTNSCSTYQWTRFWRSPIEGWGTILGSSRTLSKQHARTTSIIIWFVYKFLG